MGLIKQLFTNCACPQGRMGRAMLKFMNLCHAPLTNWGLKLVNIQDGWTMLDIGCGGGATLQRLLKRSKDAQVYGIDISEESVAKAKKVNEEVLDVTVYRVEDMHCSHCEAAVVRAVENLPGVEKAKASASANTLTIKGSATEEAIRAAVEGIGYTFKGKA